MTSTLDPFVAAAAELVRLDPTPRRPTVTEIESYLAGADGHRDDAGRSSKLVTGGAFVFDAPAAPPAVWGEGERIVWASGESLFIVGPTGVGKSTLVAQLVAGLVGLLDGVLDLPVRPIDGTVLYLAMDRPAQLQRLLARLFGQFPDARQVLDERLVIWRGPLPHTLNTRPEVLLEVCEHADAKTVIIDSLKDAAVKLTDDEAGGNINRALQLVVAEGIEAACLHHDRKATEGNRAPKAIDDVYGSALITAGAGSVIALHGQPGDAVVELRHLKQPLQDIGPLRVEHDPHTGLSSVVENFDPLRWLRGKPQGGTVIEAARLLFNREAPTANEQAKARRRLDGLVRAGLVVREEASRGGSGGTRPVRYRAVEHILEASTEAFTQGSAA